jgi:formimidoylglutamate deiminase
MEEIRILDYGQRLTSNNRNTFANKNNGNSGLSALQSTIINGRKAMGNYNDEFFKVGEKLNALVISDKHPLISSTRNENLLNTIIYSSDISMYKGTIANGDWKVQNGAIKNPKIYSDFYKVISELKNR